jgi:hypothetical protein
MQQKELDKMFISLLLVVVLANIVYFIFSILAAMAARRGQFYYFLFFGRLSYHQVFKIASDEDASTDYVNKPPI